MSLLRGYAAAALPAVADRLFELNKRSRHDVKLLRRDLLQIAAGAVFAPALAPAFALSARADDYPSRPVRIIEGFGGSGSPDLIARLMGQWLSDRLHQPFVVENRIGAGGNVATEAVVNAPPDGYTMLAVTTANAINASLYEKLNFDFLRDITPVAGVIRFPMVLLVNPSFPTKTLADFIAYAKANPGKINIASPGVGTPMHVAIELFKLMGGIDIVHVPYRGPAMAFTDLLGGQIQAFIITLSTALGFIKSGKLRALAVTGATRSDVLPDVPSISEAVPGFDAAAWNGQGVPKATPTAIVDKLSLNITAGLADPQLKERMKDLGGEVVPMRSAEFTSFIVAETAKWAKVVKFSGAKAN
jgi:tripartite-type tricarboxylate transporter receptor subunit TctC